MTEIFRKLLMRLQDLLVFIANQLNAFFLSALVQNCRGTLVKLFARLDTEKNRVRLNHYLLRPLARTLNWLDQVLPNVLQRDRPAFWVCLVLLLTILFQFSQDYSLDEFRQTGELVVITRDSATTFYQDKDGPAGPEYDYLKSFADYLGVRLKIEIRDSNREVLDAVARGEGHIAAAGLSPHDSLDDRGVIYGPEYQRINIQVVCRRNNGKPPSRLEELSGLRLVVVADSVEESRLLKLQQDYSDLSWESVEGLSVDELLEQVWHKKFDCTIANSSELNIKRRIYPELQAAFNIQDDQALVWTLAPEWEILADAIEDWLDIIDRNGTLSILRDRHYSIEEFDYVDLRTFIRLVKSRLPRLEPLFKKVAQQEQVPWTLLAALAYQESHWNRRAKSPTGVRGIMMLTLTTAREMGVESRLNAEQSIIGGAMYLKQLEHRIPQSVTGDDRWWLALAAYNIGMGHLQDARELALEFDLDPDSWLQLKGVLPLLSQKKYHAELKHGYARGSEPVAYVERVRYYEDVLKAQIAKRLGNLAS